MASQTVQKNNNTRIKDGPLKRFYFKTGMCGAEYNLFAFVCHGFNSEKVELVIIDFFPFPSLPAASFV